MPIICIDVVRPMAVPTVDWCTTNGIDGHKLAYRYTSTDMPWTFSVPVEFEFIVFISCCPLLSQAGTPSELKDIHISSPEVNMNYIRSLLFLDVCIEIVIVEQSAF